MTGITFCPTSPDLVHLCAIETRWGSFGAAVDGAGAVAVLCFPAESDEQTLRETIDEARKRHPSAILQQKDDTSHSSALSAQLNEYLNGHRQTFTLAVAPGQATAFSLTVWQATARIGFGQTMSYAQLAEQAGNAKASRATGGALGRNPIPILIPCHRVLQSGGGLGGFSGGLDWKKRLLELEGFASQARSDG